MPLIKDHFTSVDLACWVGEMKLIGLNLPSNIPGSFTNSLRTSAEKRKMNIGNFDGYKRDFQRKVKSHCRQYQLS